MFSFNCPVCGAKINSEYYDSFVLGEICPCCGNEADFDDDITEEELHMKFNESIIKKYQNQIKKELKHLGENDSITRKLAWKLLRSRWITNGYSWNWNGKNKNPDNWGIEMAQDQLKNIDIDINDYV